MSEHKRIVSLSSGCDMPVIGVGTFLLRGPKLIYEVLDQCLNSGYRSIDTCPIYRNETEIGQALKKLLPKYNLRRKDIFIISKLPPIANANPTQIRVALQNSLMALSTSYIDLYLIQWPGPGKIDASESLLPNTSLRMITWKTLISLKAEGLVNSIGVSNFTLKHLTHLVQNCNVLNGEIIPHVIQIECHPHNRQSELIDYCKAQGIHVQAHSPLGTTLTKRLREDEEIVNIAIKLGVSPARILLKWALKRGLSIIPKAKRNDHIIENVKLDFELSEDDMEILSNLPQKKYSWDTDKID